MTLIHAREALTPEGWARDVGIRIDRGGRIAEIGPADGVPDARLDLALPAPVNLHSHTFQRAMAGLTEARGPEGSDSFWTWRALMYRFLERLTPAHVEAIAAQAFVEMAEAGYAAVAEFHYLHHGPGGARYDDPAEMAARVLAAASATGLGITLLPVLYQRGGCDGRALEGGQRRFGTDPDGYARLHAACASAVARAAPDTGLGVAPHSLRAVDEAGLDAAEALARDAPIHMHLAEQMAEVAEVEAATGARPVTRLLDTRAVGPRWCLVHCTQTTPAETCRLAATGAVAGLCPITEANLGDGIFDGVRFGGAGGRFGVGTDSNVDVSLWGELAMLEYSQRLRDRSRAALAASARSTGRVLFDAAAGAGAQAAGRASGALAPGRWADILGVSTGGPRIAGRTGDTALDALVFAGAGGAGAVTDLWSAGRHIVSGGRHRDREAVATRFRATMTEIGDGL